MCGFHREAMQRSVWQEWSPASAALRTAMCVDRLGTDAPVSSQPLTTVAPTSAHEKLELGQPSQVTPQILDLQNPCEMINVYVCVKLPSLALTAQGTQTIYMVHEIAFSRLFESLLCFQSHNTLALQRV